MNPMNPIPRFWFYFRKSIFQGILPIFLSVVAFIDFIHQTSLKTHSYDHIYFYLSFILFTYAQIKVALDFIFNVCSDEILLRKEIDLHKTSLLLPFQHNDTNTHFIIVTKKVFKLRYSSSLFFKYIDKLCWFLGIDSPVLIPFEIVSKLGNVKETPTSENEEEILHVTLINLYDYNPPQYMYIRDITNTTNISNTKTDDMTETNHLLPSGIISSLDKSINDLKKEFFNMDIKVDVGKLNI